MIRCVIVDDEKDARESLEKLCILKFNNKIRIVDSVSTIKDAVSSIRKIQPDIVFLDIKFPEENGFSLFNYIENYTFSVVFITGYEEFAINAIKCSAFDYILKPVDEISLCETIAKYEGKQLIKANAERLKLLMENFTMGNIHPCKISLPTSNGYRILNTSMILYCKADDNYTNLTTYNGETILVCRTLKAIEEMLPEESFFRIHKSTLVNINYIHSLNFKNGYSLLLENGESLEIAVRRKDDLEKMIQDKFALKR